MSKQRKALITGITGQDGSYLAQLLIKKGYDVHGVVRRCSMPRLDRINHIKQFITLHTADITDSGSIHRIIKDLVPDEIYNLAAQSFVHASWDTPVSTAEMTGMAVTNVLDSVRTLGLESRIYQASSSEMFGKVAQVPQNEDTPFYPRSPYGVAKLYGHWITVNYRESFGIHCSSGILFNHESERRGENFVTRKITKWIGEFVKWRNPTNELGQILQDDIRLDPNSHQHRRRSAFVSRFRDCNGAANLASDSDLDRPQLAQSTVLRPAVHIRHSFARRQHSDRGAKHRYQRQRRCVLDGARKLLYVRWSYPTYSMLGTAVCIQRP